jgi:hypothetical protein
MRMKWQLPTFLLGAVFAVSASGWTQQTAPATTPDATPSQSGGAKQDLKTAGHDTKNAAKSAGNGVKKGTKKGYNATKNGTKKVWNKTKNTTKGAADGAKEGAKQPQ